MRSLAALLTMLLAIAAPPLAAQDIAYKEVAGFEYHQPDSGGERFLASQTAAIPQGIGTYGPFRVLDGSRAALVDKTDTASPAAFARMLRDHPGIGLIEMIDCPGTEDDRANLRLGLLIREKGIATYVPAGGSVRSGGVELFLAGARRFADPRAEFAVHAWMDEDGFEATDYAASAPENAKYLAYYRQMGLTDAQAAAFYAMTNSVPHHDARWFDGQEMGRWVPLDTAA